MVSRRSLVDTPLGFRNENLEPLNSSDGGGKSIMFSLGKVQEVCEKFLEYAGYSISEQLWIGLSKPDVLGRRVTEGKVWQIVLANLEDVDQLVEGLRDLTALKHELDKACDYVVVLPPISEYKLIEFFTGPEDWHYELKKHGFMVWLVNPDRDSDCCLMGSPQDEILRHYFAPFPVAVSFDAILPKKIVDDYRTMKGRPEQECSGNPGGLW